MLTGLYSLVGVNDTWDFYHNTSVSTLSHTAVYIIS